MGGECVAPCVGGVVPHVGDVAPTYDTPVGRPHVADGFSSARNPTPCTP